MASSLTLFDLEKRKYNRNWGKKAPYQEAKDPEMLVWYYTSADGTVRWSVKWKKTELVLQSGTINCRKGLNKLDYTMDVREPAVKKYTEALQAAQKDPKKAPEPEKADTGKYYLQKGLYTFTLEKDGYTVQKDFSID